MSFLIDPYRFGAALWTPANITTALWLDASDASTVTTVSGAVSEWRDKSGNARHATQGTAANRPAYTSAGQNGLNVLTLDGSNDSMALGSDLSLGTAHTVIVAAKNSATITAATSSQMLLSGGAYVSSSTSEWVFGAGSLTGNLTDERLYSLVIADSSGAASVFGYGKTNADVSGGLIVSESFTTTGNAFTGRLNGSADYATASIAGGFSSTSARYPTVARGIGYRYSNNASFWNGQIWEIVLTASALSLSDTQRIEGYLAHKWGLAGSLPAGHPYKSAAPTIPAGMDGDALAYIEAVEAADGQALETAVKAAINAFVIGCKDDGSWTAIKASCILAGARTLSGALVPLVGTAPTNFNFVSGDYDRKTGLKGNGSSKYLNSNRADNADPRDNAHVSAYLSESGSGGANTAQAYITGSTIAAPPDGISFPSTRGVIRFNQVGGSLLTGTGFYVRTADFEGPSDINLTGFVGSTRTASTSFIRRSSATNTTVNRTSRTPGNTTLGVFAERRDGSVFGRYSDARIAFYSIGQSLDLALLDSRVSTLISAYAAAIP